MALCVVKFHCKDCICQCRGQVGWLAHRSALLAHTLGGTQPPRVLQHTRLARTLGPRSATSQLQEQQQFPEPTQQPSVDDDAAAASLSELQRQLLALEQLQSWQE